MKTVYIQAEADGRIVSLTEEDYGFDGYQPVEVEDDFDVLTIDDYRLQEGQLVYTGEGTAARKEAEKQAQAEAERKQAIDDGCQAFFIDGGKAQMEQDIRDAAASGGEAKQAADTAVASVNEYMDALLGLNTTDETEATDAE